MIHLFSEKNNKSLQIMQRASSQVLEITASRGKNRWMKPEIY
jgi:hypothetical protein